MIFLWLRITIIALVLHLIWYWSTSWVKNIGDLLLVLIFWFRIITCVWLWVIASNVLKIRNDWAVVGKYATAIVYVGTHFFPQFLQNSRSHSNAYNNVISSEKHAPIKWERDWWFSRISVWYYWWPSQLREVWV